jgi:hypothetical protein
VQLHLTLQWSFLLCHRFSISVISVWSQRALLVISVALSCINLFFLVSLGHQNCWWQRNAHKIYSIKSVWYISTVEFDAAMWPLAVSALSTLSCHWHTWIVLQFCKFCTEPSPLLGIYN